MLTIFVAAYVIWFAAPDAARAAADAIVNLERAKVLFSEGEYRQALDFLEFALEEEPANVEALHYAGLCLMALDRSAEAADNLTKAADESTDPDADLLADLAWARVSAGRFQAALEAAQASLAKQPADRARLYRGRALMGLSRYEQALPVFWGLRDSPDWGQAGHYYAGLCLVHLGRTEEARAEFEAANQLAPRTEIGAEAGEYAKSLAPGAEKPGPLSLRARLLYQYDTNIALVEDEDLLPEELTEKEDSRGVFDLDFRYDFARSGNGGAWVRYTGYVSMHGEEDALDLMYHRAELGGLVRAPVDDLDLKVGGWGSYSCSWLDWEWYTQEWSGVFESRMDWADVTRTRVLVEYSGEWFDEPGDDDNDRDNTEVEYYIYQHLFIAGGKVNLWAGYSYGTLWAEGENYSRIENTGHAGMVAAVPGGSLVAVLFRYEDRDYPDNSFDREERRSIASASWQIPIYGPLHGYLGAAYQTADANLDNLEYERWIYSAGVMAVY